MAITTNFVDPVSRIEGHLGIKLTVNTGVVTSADAVGNLWRGFENFLIGREPNDAITFTQRICGVCPVPHGTTATYNVESVIGYNTDFQTWANGKGYIAADGTVNATGNPSGVPEKAMHVRNLVLGNEFLMSSMTHFYHLAAPSYVQGPNVPPWTPYFDNSFYNPLLLSSGHGTGDLTAAGGQTGAGGATMPANDPVQGFSKDLWSAVIKQYVHALRIRRLTFEAGALFAGRMPMSSALVAGGVGLDKNEVLSGTGKKCDVYNTLMTEVGNFIVKEYVPLALALGALYPNYDNTANATTSNAVNPVGNPAKLWAIAGNGPAPVAANTGYGAGLGKFLAWGGFPQTDGTLALGRGYKIGSGAAAPIVVADVLANLREDITHSRYTASKVGPLTDPSKEDRTIPDRSAAGRTAGKYSWLKAPRWGADAMEVGPLARLAVMGAYPVDGSTALSAKVPGYGAYLKTVGAADGLDPAMIDADLAVALVREGLATLNANGTIVDNTNFATALPTASAVASAYGAATTVIQGNINDWVRALVGGLSTMDRLRARALESLVLVQKLIGAVGKNASGPTFTPAGTNGWNAQLAALPAGSASYRHISVPAGRVSGFGATEAPRGALMHMCTIENGKLVQYQCIVPTTWNGSPKDAGLNPGAMEKAMEGIPFSSASNHYKNQAGASIATQGGVEALRVAQSFDPCIACAVH